MKLANRVAQGAYAGLTGGVAVAIFFLVGDLIQLHPLSTPLALGYTFLGPGGTSVDLPVLSQVLIWTSAGVKLLAFTVMHLGAFAALGIAAVFLFDGFGWNLNIWTGALFGLVGCSAVFYLALALADGGMVSELPALWSVAVGNLLAGGLIGGQASLLRSHT